jgi:uncharacterized protein with FMN-binding domain
MDNKKLITPILIGVAVVILLGAGGFWYYQSTLPVQAPVVTLPKTSTPSPANQPETTQPSVTTNQLANPSSDQTATSTTTTAPTTTTPAPSGTTTTTPAQTPTSTPTQAPASTPITTTSAYKNGTYSASGSYSSPGGTQSLDLAATISDGKITQIQMTSKATDAKSERYQSLFKDGISGIIVGKSLDDDLDPGVVNGSSLTQNGFVQAINSIKTQAKN